MPPAPGTESSAFLRSQSSRAASMSSPTCRERRSMSSASRSYSSLIVPKAYPSSDFSRSSSFSRRYSCFSARRTAACSPVSSARRRSARSRSASCSRSSAPSSWVIVACPTPPRPTGCARRLLLGGVELRDAGERPRQPLGQRRARPPTQRSERPRRIQARAADLPQPPRRADGVERQQPAQLAERGVAPRRDVEGSLDVGIARGEERLDDVADIHEVARLAAVAEYRGGSPLRGGATKDRDHAGLTVRALARSVDVRHA